MEFIQDKVQIIRSIGDFINLITPYSENIIYGAGKIGKTLCTFLKKRDKLRNLNFPCIAVSDMYRNPTFIDDIPVITLECLQHYKDTANFIIATVSYTEEIYNKLVEFGCKHIIMLTPLCISEIEKEVLVYENSISLKKISDDLSEHYKEMQLIVEEQFETATINTNAFLEYKNKNRGKSIVIVGGGPSLEKYIPIEGALHIGMNRSWKRKDIYNDYYFVQDGIRKHLESGGEGLKKGISDNIFIGCYHERCEYRDIEFPEEYFIMNNNTRRFFLDPQPTKFIYKDISYHNVMDFGSVAFSALHFALYTYPEKIYLVGCDTDYSGYFYDNSKMWASDKLIRMCRLGYARVKAFSKQFYPETNIVSINPVGLKGLFEDVYS